MIVCSRFVCVLLHFPPKHPDTTCKLFQAAFTRNVAQNRSFETTPESWNFGNANCLHDRIPGMLCVIIKQQIRRPSLLGRTRSSQAICAAFCTYACISYQNMLERACVHMHEHTRIHMRAHTLLTCHDKRMHEHTHARKHSLLTCHPAGAKQLVVLVALVVGVHNRLGDLLQSVVHFRPHVSACVETNQLDARMCV
jgi:hypothetical protein